MKYTMKMPRQIRRNETLVLLKKGQVVTEEEFPDKRLISAFIKSKVMVEGTEPEGKVLKKTKKDSAKKEAKAQAKARKWMIKEDVEVVKLEDVKQVEDEAEKAEEAVDEAVDSVIEEPMPNDTDPEVGTTGMIALSPEVMALANSTDEEYKASNHKEKMAITRARKKLKAIVGD